jgi:hypothetical protein
LRNELHGKGLEVVTVSLDITGAEGSRSFIEAANPEHPSLLDPTHQMDALFGVVNIPNVVWIDEQGMIVRPAEPGWPGARQEMPKGILGSLPKMGRAPKAPPTPEGANPMSAIGTGQDRSTYHEAIRDWVANGAASAYVLSPDEVIARSQPRPIAKSEGAAHFELGNHLWRNGQRDLALPHFNEANRLQPDNWTYKRQAWSLVGSERAGGDYGKFVQGPLEGEEESWPFDSDFWSDVSNVPPGEYYPNTMA